MEFTQQGWEVEQYYVSNKRDVIIKLNKFEEICIKLNKRIKINYLYCFKN